MSEKITLEDLKKHCIKTIEACEQFRKLPNVVVTDDRRNQEHKMVLQLIEEHEQRQSTDAVSREAVLKAFNDYCKPNCEYSKKQRNVMCGACKMGDAIEIVEEFPPVTPERPKGEWKYTDEVHEIATCSKCSFLIDASGCVDPEEYISIYRYCPNCGADMRGVGE